MADATASDVTTRVLQNLSLLPGGETAEAEDAALVLSFIISTNEELRELEICYWSDAAFPQAILNAFARYVSCHAADPLYPGNPQGAAAYRATHEANSLAQLRVLAANRMRVDTPTFGLYF